MVLDNNATESQVHFRWARDGGCSMHQENTRTGVRRRVVQAPAVVGAHGGLGARDGRAAGLGAAPSTARAGSELVHRERGGADVHAGARRGRDPHGSRRPGRHRHSTLSSTVIDRHCLGMYTVILLASWLPFSVKMTAPPVARPARLAATAPERRGRRG
jgi:hypothetical protein